MSPPRTCKTFSAALVLGLGLGAPSLAPAQQTNPGNTNISTGSGAGTSPGVSPGSSPSGTRIGNSGLRSPTPGFGPQDQPGAVDAGPPAGDRPDFSGLPAAIDNQPRTVFTQAEVNQIDAQMLTTLGAVPDQPRRPRDGYGPCGPRRSSLPRPPAIREGAGRGNAAVTEGGAAAALRAEDLAG